MKDFNKRAVKIAQHKGTEVISIQPHVHVLHRDYWDDIEGMVRKTPYGKQYTITVTYSVDHEGWEELAGDTAMAAIYG